MYTFNASNLSCVRQQKTIFAGVSFDLKAGQLLLVEGPNGSGKSSLLKLLTGIATPYTGAIQWQGECIHEFALEFRSILHYVAHGLGIKLGLTVHENLQLMATLAECEFDRPHLQAILATLQLQEFEHTQARYLSAGQKRRIALAKLFLLPKPLWILDEPLTALDQTTQTLFLAALETHLQNNGIAIISSHHAISLNAPTQTLRLVC